MIKRMIIMLAILGLLAGLIYGFEQGRAKGIATAIGGLAFEAQTVATTTAKIESWQPTIQTVGSLRAINGADLSLDAAGVVEQISFNSGDDVKAGQALLKLRTEDDPAKLAALKATADLAKLVYQRDQRQFKAEAVSQATLDSDEANLRNAEAQVAQQIALMEKKILRAPFDGRLGIRAVDLGQFLNAGTMIVTLQQLNQIYVDFFLPENILASLQLGQTVHVGVDAFPGQTFTGQIIAIDPKVDSGSRNVQVRAKLANDDHRLLPGMFAKILVEQSAPVDRVTLPATAISFNSYGSTVFVVDDKGKDEKGKANLVARQTFVTTGDARGDQVAVVKGVKAGDVVVTAGQLKLRNGTSVLIDNSVAPSNDAAPVPTDN